MKRHIAIIVVKFFVLAGCTDPVAGVDKPALPPFGQPELQAPAPTHDLAGALDGAADIGEDLVQSDVSDAGAADAADASSTDAIADADLAPGLDTDPISDVVADLAPDLVADQIADLATAPAATPPCIANLGLAPLRSKPCELQSGSLLNCFTFESDMDNGDGTFTIVDSSPAGNNAVGSNHDFGPGPDGQALISSVAKVTTVDVPLTAAHKGAVSFDFWLFANQMPATRYGIIDYSSGFHAFLYAGGFLRLGCSSTQVDTSAIPIGEWVHVACVNDGNEVRVYINGAPDLTAIDATTTYDQGATRFTLARNEPSGDTLDGALDNVRIWTSAPPADAVCQSAVRWD